MVKVGVLALQGAFGAHARCLRALGAEPLEVRTPADLDEVDALILPGGESTTMSMLLESSGLYDPVAERLAATRGNGANPAMAAFESIARADSTARVADIADGLGVSVRHFERLCHDHFGHGPKAVLRRSRFLDMAQAIRGFSAPSEQELAAMRYFDQSHRNREFQHFVRMTARTFETTPTPLLTAGLKLRAEGVS